MTLAGEADESLRVAGFVPCGEMLDEGSDDEDGDIRPPPHAFLACGGGIRTHPQQLDCWTVPIELWSSEEENSDGGVGFACGLDAPRGIVYAKLQLMAEISEWERATKGAITTLLDVAEACSARIITVGLSQEQAHRAGLVRSLLSLGFQTRTGGVPPSRKSPLLNTALLLDFDFDVGGPAYSDADDWCFGASDCSTSAEDDEPFDSECPESD